MNRELSTRCCIAGGGPAGLMLGLLLARAGIPVVVLEQHADFLRDFRGDTIHPSTLEVVAELGLDGGALALPHQRLVRVSGQYGGLKLTLADFSQLPVRHPFIAMMPQWDFLDFIANQARRLPCFTLLMRARAERLIQAGGEVSGVRATTPDGPLEVVADLTVAADGRNSSLRAQSGLGLVEIAVPIDVLWFRLSRRREDPAETLGQVAPGGFLVHIDRGAYWQCALVIPKGSAGDLREQGLAAFRQEVARILPWAAERLEDDVGSWDEVHLLAVRIDRLRTWYRPRLLLIGDAAHAMSPVGGVGINLAIQDAVAAANVLWEPLRRGRPDVAQLAAVQRRRDWPTRLTQRLQAKLQSHVIRPAITSGRRARPPLVLRLVARHPALQRLLARIIGLGFRPEHVQSPALPPAQ